MRNETDLLHTRIAILAGRDAHILLVSDKFLVLDFVGLLASFVLFSVYSNSTPSNSILSLYLIPSRTPTIPQLLITSLRLFWALARIHSQRFVAEWASLRLSPSGSRTFCPTSIQWPLRFVLPSGELSMFAMKATRSH